MNMRRALDQYKSVDLNSLLANANPHQQVLMLLSGAIDRVSTAKGAIETGQTELKGTSISKAITIIGGLQAALEDLENNEVAQNLDRLYTYMYETLLKANLQSSTALLDEVKKLLLEIKTAWEQIPAGHHNTTSANG